jgi:hypothetical protein
VKKQPRPFLLLPADPEGKGDVDGETAASENTPRCATQSEPGVSCDSGFYAD